MRGHARLHPRGQDAVCHGAQLHGQRHVHAGRRGVYGADEGEISEDLEDDGDADLNADNLEGTTDEDENNVQEEDVEVNSEEEIEVDQPDVGVEDNSSEPSSSTGTRGSTMAGAQGSGVSGYEHDHGDTDSVVPTTPKLVLPRRNDGFAEAVSSPQVL